MQLEITKPGPLLSPDGSLASVGWARQPILDCNLENAQFYDLHFMQPFRIKRWDYYALFTPRYFFSATIADLGYAGNIFVYMMDLESGDLHEESLVIPLGKGISLPRNSTSGISHFESKNVSLDFRSLENRRFISVSWPKFRSGRGIQAEFELHSKPEDESMNIIIPIANKRFYYNRKINCMPASGSITYGDEIIELNPENCIGSLDWGRGVWEYKSFWNWASSSGFLPDGRTIGLNLGMGFGDLSKAGENAIILDNRIHKLDVVPFEYDQEDYMQPWHFKDNQGRLDIEFKPFKDRTATTNLGIIYSQVHQMFGKFSGFAIADDGEKVIIHDLIGFAEEHVAKW